MKTEKTNHENKVATETNTEQRSRNWQSGVSSSIGAAVGVAAGSMAQSAFAAEPGTEEEVQPMHTTNTAATTSDIHNAEPNSPVTPFATEPTATPSANNGAETPDNVTVVSYETVTNEDGSQMDVAAVVINGQETVIVDVDQDGLADIMAIDMDGNGTITENEIANIQEENIHMQDLAQAANQTHFIEDPTLVADAGGMPDYTNDADVAGYMA